MIARMIPTRMIYNFSAGPAILPDSVIEKAQKAVFDWQGKGLSILSLSHRSDDFIAIAEQSIQDVRDLLAVPADYEVMFIAGGATQHFSMVPQNLAKKTDTAYYIDSGLWSKKAMKTAEPMLEVLSSPLEIARPMSENFHGIDSSCAYLHITPNETIDGIAYDDLPEVTDIPIVADMSSSIFSRAIDISKYGLIYAGTQKNMGISGLSLVIIRKDLLSRVRDITPPLYRYDTYVKDYGIHNTPPTFAWYVCALTLKWLKKEGGVLAMLRQNQQKAALLYAAIDQSDFFINTIPKAYRSMMNVVFQFKEPSTAANFFHQAQDAGLIGLSGHRVVGGVRASIYNAMPLEGVKALVEFMGCYANCNDTHHV